MPQEQRFRTGPTPAQRLHPDAFFAYKSQHKPAAGRVEKRREGLPSSLVPMVQNQSQDAVVPSEPAPEMEIRKILLQSIQQSTKLFGPRVRPYDRITRPGFGPTAGRSYVQYIFGVVFPKRKRRHRD